MPILTNSTVDFLQSATANHTNATTSTAPANSECDQTALSAGSAAFILIALILGCMTQPAGSLVTHTCNRFWRISPFLSILESILIFSWLLVPSINEVRTFIGRRLPQTYSGSIAPSGRAGDMSLKVAAYVALVKRLANTRKHDYWAKEQQDGLSITACQIELLTGEVQNLERGATLRPAIILPMMLQFFKIMFISAGSWWKMWPLVYFFSWLSVELLLLIVHGSPLEGEELSQVQSEISAIFAATVVQGQQRILRPKTNESSSSTATPDGGTAAVPEESRGLLQQSSPSRSLPQHRVYFQGKRRSLKTMRGNPSMGFVLMALGRVAVTLESYCHMLPILLWIDMPSGLHIFLYMFLSLGPLVLLDMLGGFVVLALQIWWFKREEVEGAGIFVGMRDLVAFKTAVVWMIYYLCIYTSDGMSKPIWLDWLG